MLEFIPDLRSRVGDFLGKARPRSSTLFLFPALAREIPKEQIRIKLIVITYGYLGNGVIVKSWVRISLPLKREIE